MRCIKCGKRTVVLTEYGICTSCLAKSIEKDYILTLLIISGILGVTLAYTILYFLQ